MRSRVYLKKSAELSAMDEMSAVCAGVRGVSQASVWFHFSNFVT